MVEGSNPSGVTDAGWCNGSTSLFGSENWGSTPCPAAYMIIKRKKGYYVISEKSKKNLGGPYKTKEEAVKRLQQVEYFKRSN